MALPRPFRLQDKYDFNRVKRLGQSFSTPLFFLNLAPAKDPSHLRFGFVISTKIDKRATVRNRVKRLLSEVVRQRLEKACPAPHVVQGFDVVIVAKSAIVGKSYEEINQAFNQVLPKTPLAHP